MLAVLPIKVDINTDGQLAVYAAGILSPNAGQVVAPSVNNRLAISGVSIAGEAPGGAPA